MLGSHIESVYFLGAHDFPTKWSDLVGLETLKDQPIQQLKPLVDERGPVLFELHKDNGLDVLVKLSRKPESNEYDVTFSTIGEYRELDAKDREWLSLMRAAILSIPLKEMELDTQVIYPQNPSSPKILKVNSVVSYGSPNVHVNRAVDVYIPQVEMPSANAKLSELLATYQAQAAQIAINSTMESPNKILVNEPRGEVPIVPSESLKGIPYILELPAAVKNGEDHSESILQAIRELTTDVQQMQFIRQFAKVLTGTAKAGFAVGKFTLGPLDVLLGIISAIANVIGLGVVVVGRSLPYIRNEATAPGGYKDQIRRKVMEIKHKLRAQWDVRFKGMTDAQVAQKIAMENQQAVLKVLKNREGMLRYMQGRSIEELLALPKELLLFLNSQNFLSTSSLGFLQSYGYITNADIDGYKPPVSGEVHESESDSSAPAVIADPSIIGDYFSAESDLNDWADTIALMLEEEMIGVVGVDDAIFVAIISAVTLITVAVIGGGALILSKVAPGIIDRAAARYGSPIAIVKKGIRKAVNAADYVFLRIRGKSNAEAKAILQKKVLERMKKMTPQQADIFLVNMSPEQYPILLGLDQEQLTGMILNEKFTLEQYRYVLEQVPALKSLDISGTFYNPQYLKTISARTAEEWKATSHAELMKYIRRCVLDQTVIFALLDAKVLQTTELTGIECLIPTVIAYTKYSGKTTKGKGNGLFGTKGKSKGGPTPSAPPQAMGQQMDVLARMYPKSDGRLDSKGMTHVNFKKLGTWVIRLSHSPGQLVIFAVNGGTGSRSSVHLFSGVNRSDLSEPQYKFPDLRRGDYQLMAFGPDRETDRVTRVLFKHSTGTSDPEAQIIFILLLSIADKLRLLTPTLPWYVRTGRNELIRDPTIVDWIQDTPHTREAKLISVNNPHENLPSCQFV